MGLYLVLGEVSDKDWKLRVPSRIVLALQELFVLFIYFQVVTLQTCKIGNKEMFTEGSIARLKIGIFQIEFVQLFHK